MLSPLSMTPEPVAAPVTPEALSNTMPNRPLMEGNNSVFHIASRQQVSAQCVAIANGSNAARRIQKGVPATDREIGYVSAFVQVTQGRQETSGGGAAIQYGSIGSVCATFNQVT